MIADTCTVCDGLFWVSFANRHTHLCSKECEQKYDEAYWKEEEE